MRTTQDSIKAIEPDNQGVQYYLDGSSALKDDNASDTSESAYIDQDTAQQGDHANSQSFATQTKTTQSFLTQTSQDSSIENPTNRSSAHPNSRKLGFGLFKSLADLMPKPATGLLKKLSSNGNEEFTSGLKTFYDSQGNYYEALEASQKITNNFFTKTSILDLSNFNLVELPKEINKLNHLRELNLSGNKLKDFTIDISKFKDLERLDLSHNNLSFENATSLAKKLNGLKKFKKLDLSNNNFSKEQLLSINKILNYGRKDPEIISLSQAIVSADFVTDESALRPTPDGFQAKSFRNNQNTVAP